SSVSAPSPRESRLHPLSKARIPAWLASPRTIAHSRLLPCPHALASAARRKTSAPHRPCGQVGVPRVRRFPCPPSQFAGSANASLPLQSTCSAPFLPSRGQFCAAKSTRPRGGADVVI